MTGRTEFKIVLFFSCLGYSASTSALSSVVEHVTDNDEAEGSIPSARMNS